MNTSLTILGQAAGEQVGLTVGGTIVMTVSVVLVLGLTVFCMSRILMERRPSGVHHAPLDIDTHDREP